MKRVPTSTIAPVFMLIALAGCKPERGAKPTAKTPAKSRVWFGDVTDSASVDAGPAKNVAAALWRGLHNDLSKPALVDNKHRPTLLFVSVSDGKTPARVALGSGKTVNGAVSAALGLLGEMKPAIAPRWLKLEFVTEVRRAGTSVDIQRGLEGVATGKQAGVAQPPGVFAVSDRQTRRTMKRRAEFVFRTEGFFYDGQSITPLFRDHRRTRSLRPARLLDAARAGADYLVRMREDNGKFVYSYSAVRNRADDSYNLVRHAGTVYSMLQTYRVTRDAKLLRAAERSIEYLRTHIKPYRKAAILLSRDRIKLGGVALAAVALAEHVRATGNKRHLELAQKLCDYIRFAQRKDGSFVHSRDYDSGKARDFRSQYYPGEAMLALLRVHSIDNNAAWLNAAERAARYLILVRDKATQTSDLIHDHWLLYALNELYRQRKRPLYLAHAARIVEAIVISQNTRSAIEDHVGSYYKTPRSTPTATRSEGLLAAYSLINDFGDKQLAKRVRRAVELGIGFQLHTQITRERAMHLRDPRRSLGGFTRSLTNFEVRIDYVQHNISALILFHQLLSP